MQRGEVIVTFLMKDIVVDSYTRRNQFSYPALYNGFGGFRVFQLVADGYALPGPYQFW
ncbi:hypothetical protein GALL_407910 [mine drainage metagenome]|uniref:Uncharacterized protein n=1 Tax=mine drainage metagenome TaxID=410659 RepID=A0A1J5Q1B1_9ZZZZ